MEKVALITGANAGIGFALAERLLSNHPNLRLCLVCRNQVRANSARDKLLYLYPEAKVDVILCDISSVKSVIQCCGQIKQKYSHIDWLYLNAGIITVTGVDWKNLVKAFFSFSVRDLGYTLTTGHGLLKQVDGDLTPDGLQQTFATNLFGHFVMVNIQELMEVLGGDRTSQVMWTSSTNADKKAFSLNDIQHKHGKLPYASSKYAIDLLSYELNSRFNSQGIYSHTTCAGFVMTNLTGGILPVWILTLLLPILVLLRIITPVMAISPFNGCESLVWLSNQQPEGLDPKVKFYSKVSVIGDRYVTEEKMDINIKDGPALYEALDTMLQKLLKRTETTSTT